MFYSVYRVTANKMFSCLCDIVGVNMTIMVVVATLIGLVVLICGLLLVHRSVHVYTVFKIYERRIFLG